MSEDATQSRRSRRFLAYEVSVVACALLLAVLAFAGFRVPSWSSAFFFVALCVLAEYFAIRLPSGGAVSLSSSLALAAVLSGGPATGVIVAALGSISLSDIKARKPLAHMVFNTAQYVVTTVLAAFVLAAVGVPSLELAGGHAVSGAMWVAAALGAAVVLALTNAVLVGSAVALLTGARFRAVLAEFFGWYAVSVVALALLGLVMAELLYVAGTVGTLLIVVPFSIARQTFEVYQQQSVAYRETVRSLVTAIEAKDPYTRGHSERVAWYARALSERIQLPESQRQSIEWAALLHDVGKVALDTEMLRKPDQLTAAEYELVREHPARAVDILSGIDFLEESIPFVSAHHERIDGTGYPAGLAADQIPLGAKILAIADSFDAMTSTRAYREAFTFESACAELACRAGTQFDPTCVEEFLEIVDASMVTQLLETREWTA